MIFCVGIISISEIDSFHLKDLQFKKINETQIHTASPIRASETHYSDGSRFANSLELLHSAYVFLSVLGWVSGTKLGSVSKKDQWWNQESLKNNNVAVFPGQAKVKVTIAIQYPETVLLPVQLEP